MNFQQLQNANELEIQCDQALLDVPEEKAEKHLDLSRYVG